MHTVHVQCKLNIYIFVSKELLIEYLVENIFSRVGNRVYEQCVGIPMGTDCAPLIANLYSFFYDYNYTKSLLKIILTELKIH